MNLFQPPDEETLPEYASFLKNADSSSALAWERLCKADFEAASCEAYAWKFLTQHGIEVRPNTRTNSLGLSVDFECCRGGEQFYVEVTCIKTNTMTNATHLEHADARAVRHYSLPTGAIRRECCAKARQCSGWGKPTVLLVGTFHSSASRLLRPNCQSVDQLLTGETACSVTLLFSGNSVNPVGSQVISTGRNAAFSSVDWEAARRSISSLILVGFGTPYY